MNTTDLNEIGKFMVAETKKTLLTPVPARTFGGMNKPINGQFPTPFSAKVASRDFIDSLDYRIIEDPKDGELVIQVFSKLPDDQNYGPYINNGRFEGTWPDIVNISTWITQKGIIPQPLAQKKGDKVIYRIPTLKQLTFLLSRSIFETGIFPYPYEDITKERILKDLVKKLEPVALAQVTKLIREQVIFEINPGRRTNL